MIQHNPVMRICIACKKTFDRKNLLKITKDHKKGITFQNGMGDQLTFALQKNVTQILRSKKSFKKL